MIMKKKTWVIILCAAIAILAAVAVFLHERYKIADIIDDEAECDLMDAAVQPVPVAIDVNNLGDGIYPVAFSQEEVEKSEGGVFIPFEIFNMDLYDAVELHQLKVGDYIKVSGELVKIDSLSIDGPVIINGGLDYGGIELVSVGGGVYRLQGWDDIATYTSLGKVRLFVPETIDFRDKGNVEDSMEGVNVSGKDLYDYLKNVNFGSFNEYSTKIRIENGAVVEFWRIYRP